MDFSPSGKLMVSGTVDGTIIIWRVETGQTTVLSITSSSGKDFTSSSAYRFMSQLSLMQILFDIHV
jgi:WD40 repeat protein